MRNVRGWERFRGALKKLQGAARDELRDAVHASAKETAGVIRTLAPRDEGDLASTVRITPGKHDLQVRITAGGAKTTKASDGGTYDYARAAEFGRQGQEPEPFFFPVVRSQRKAHRARMSRAMNRAIKKAME